MEIIKAIKRFFCDYCVVVRFTSLARETKKNGACIQFIPSVNFWFKRYDPTYPNGFFIGWLMWGVSIDFANKVRHLNTKTFKEE